MNKLTVVLKRIIANEKNSDATIRLAKQAMEAVIAMKEMEEGRPTTLEEDVVEYLFDLG